MKLGSLYGVGIGPGDPRYLTFRAAEVLRGADVIFTVISANAEDSTSESVVGSLSPRGKIRRLVFSMSRDAAVRQAQVEENAAAILKELRAGRNCAFATLGDAMTYSTFGYVLRIIRQQHPELDVEIVPGITSFATFAAKAKTVLVENGQQLRVVPSFRAEMADSLQFPAGSTTVLLKTYRSRKALLERLAREEDVEILYGEHLSMPDECILTDLPSVAERPETYLSLMLVKKK